MINPDIDARSVGVGGLKVTCIGQETVLGAMLCEVCMCKRDAPMCVRVRLWPLRREASSRVLIGAAGT